MFTFPRPTIWPQTRTASVDKNVEITSLATYTVTFSSIILIQLEPKCSINI